MEGIPIDRETVERFKANEYSNESDPGNDSALVGLNEAASWLLRTLDKLARNKDERYGTDPESIELVGELGVLVAKRNISREKLEQSPEIFLATVLTGLGIEKFMVHQEIKKERLAQAERQEEPQGKEEKLRLESRDGDGN